MHRRSIALFSPHHNRTTLITRIAIALSNCSSALFCVFCVPAFPFIMIMQLYGCNESNEIGDPDTPTGLPGCVGCVVAVHTERGTGLTDVTDVPAAGRCTVVLSLTRLLTMMVVCPCSPVPTACSSSNHQ